MTNNPPTWQAIADRISAQETRWLEDHPSYNPKPDSEMRAFCLKRCEEHKPWMVMPLMLGMLNLQMNFVPRRCVQGGFNAKIQS